MTSKKIVLKPGKEKAIKNRHHWIFSGAVLSLPNFENGEILPLYSSLGEFLGRGYFNSKAKILGRMISFDDTPAIQSIQNNLEKAMAFREHWFDRTKTNAYRLVNGEGDFLPGLIIDQYNDTLVMQIGTLGMQKLQPMIVEYLTKHLKPSVIYEKSILPSRKEEGLANFQDFLYGNSIDKVEMLENHLKYQVSLLEGQKTGFFLDHREMRLLVRNLSHQKRVLNCFSYTGGFSTSAAAGGAITVDSVDISENAIETAKDNMKINGFTGNHYQFFAEDVFDFLRKNELPYDLVILDPPAFAKKLKDIISACRGYKDINRIAIQKMPSSSLLLTCSCSYYVDEPLFQKVIFQAAVEAKRNVRIIGRHQLAPDHPINICHPESDYLKSLLLFIE